MMRSGPTIARAAAALPSSSPRCTPSAPTAAQSAASSLTMNSAPRSAAMRASASACARTQARRGAVLLRYWIAPAPPASAASTRATRSAGVREVRRHRVEPDETPRAGAPDARPRRQCRLRGIGSGWRRGVVPGRGRVLPRPEQPIGDELAHARPVRALQRLPHVVLRLAHRIGQIEPVGEHGGNGGRQRATGAMVAAGQTRPGVAAHDAVLRVQRVDDLRRGLVRAGDEHVLRHPSRSAAPRRWQAARRHRRHRPAVAPRCCSASGSSCAAAAARGSRRSSRRTRIRRRGPTRARGRAPAGRRDSRR